MSTTKLEVVVLAVADVDRAKRFYANLGWRLDADFVMGEEFRIVQFTPPGHPARSNSAGDSPAGDSRLPRRARYRDSISSCPTSWQRAQRSPGTVWM